MIHELKTWPAPFREVVLGHKTHEIRKTDRLFAVGDKLWLREYDPKTESYTGQHCLVQVSYVTSGEWGIPNDLCVMSIKCVAIWGRPGCECPPPDGHMCCTNSWTRCNSALRFERSGADKVQQEKDKQDECHDPMFHSGDRS